MAVEQVQFHRVGPISDQPSVTTSSNASTKYVLTAHFRGVPVQLEWMDGEPFPPCPSEEHEVVVMHHTDEDGRHYCPTGFIYCARCFAIGKEPEPFGCTRWEANLLRFWPCVGLWPGSFRVLR